MKNVFLYSVVIFVAGIARKAVFSKRAEAEKLAKGAQAAGFDYVSVQVSCMEEDLAKPYVAKHELTTHEMVAKWATC